jgi:Acyl-[acyl carrier protein]--UDP-N-acetylglucosamine O-acyltransferase
MGVNQIHPTVVITGDVKLGKNNQILPYTILTGPLEIGDDNIIGPHAVIGSPGGDTRNPRYDSSQSPIRIGSRNIIREFVAVQKPCYEDMTIIGDDVYVMQGVHVPHDAVLEDKVVIAALSAVAGITKVLEGAYLAQGSTISQYSVIGQYAIVAMGAPVVKNVRPFSRYIPGKPTSVNAYAIKKYGFEEYRDEIVAYVLNGEPPSSPRIKAIVDRFDMLSEASGRPVYGIVGE